MDRRIESTPLTAAEAVHPPLAMAGPPGFPVEQGSGRPPAARWLRPR
jgi:hypothetical protein